MGQRNQAKGITLLLRPRSGDGPVLTAKLLPAGNRGRRFPMLRVGGDLAVQP